MSDASFLQSLSALLNNKQSRELKRVEPRGPLGGKRVSVEYKKAATGTGTGIASPLTEVSRTRHPERVVWSADGLVPLILRRTATIKMKDGNDNEIEQVFLNVP